MEATEAIDAPVDVEAPAARPAAFADDQKEAAPAGVSVATASSASFADELSKIDPVAAERLNQFRRDLSGPRAVEMSLADLNAVLNPAAIEEKAAAHFYGARTRLALAEWIRNVLILLPIVLTWYGLYRASDAYSRAIAADPALVTQPFLLLWQQDFRGLVPGGAPLLTFSQLAMLDAILLGVVVLLTIYVHWYRDKREYEAGRKAATLRCSAEEVAWQLSLMIASQRAAQSQSTLVHNLSGSLDSFIKDSSAVLEGIAGQKTRLERLNTQQDVLVQNLDSVAGKLNVFDGQLKVRVDDMLKYGDLVTGVGERLDGSIKDFASRVDRLEGTQNKLLIALAEVAALKAVMQAAGTDLQEAAQKLQQGDQQRIQNMNALRDAGNRLDTVATKLSLADQQLTEVLNRIPGNFESLMARFDASIETLDSTSKGLGKGIDTAALAFVEAAEDVRIPLEASVASTSEAAALNRDIQGTINEVIGSFEALFERNTTVQNAVNGLTHNTNTLINQTSELLQRNQELMEKVVTAQEQLDSEAQDLTQALKGMEFSASMMARAPIALWLIAGLQLAVLVMLILRETRLFK